MILLLALACRPSPPPAGILLVTVDTWRADHLDATLAPNAWAVAERGRRYTHAWSPIGLTTPAHASLFTGLRPPDHGMRGNNHHGYQLGEEFTTLAEVLSAAGWDTAAFVSAYPAGDEGGLAQGFATFDAPESSERATSEAVAGARAWLAEREGPWFLWVHAYDPHGPYAPPEADRAAARGGDDDAGRYRGEVRAADRALGPLYDLALRGGGWVAITSDHGEIHDEERCGWQHERSSAREVLRVPLVVAGPGLVQGVDSREVGLIDLFPTILGWAGVPDPGGHAGQPLTAPGRSFWIGESGLCDPECARGCAPAGFVGKDRVVFSGGAQLVDRPGVGQLGDPALAHQLDGYPPAQPPAGDLDVEQTRALGYTEGR